MSWLVDWWHERCADDRQRLYPIEAPEERAVPAYPWLPDGTKTEVPVSFVAAATSKRYPALFNLDQLRRSTLDALAGKPDTRTQQQRSRDDWAAYLQAKVKYGAEDTADSGRAVGVEEAGQASEGAQAEAGSLPAVPAD